MSATTQHNESHELSQNIKPQPSNYGVSFEGHHSEGVPKVLAYIGYMDSGESSQPSEFPPTEKQNTPFIGYFYPGPQEHQQTGSPNVALTGNPSPKGDRGFFKQYSRRRGRSRGRGRGHAQGPPRPKEQIGPRLYYPNNRQSQSGFTLGLPPSHGPPTSCLLPQRSLNSLTYIHIVVLKICQLMNYLYFHFRDS